MKILKGNTVNFEITINLSASGLVGVNLDGLILQIAAINNAYVVKLASSEITVVDAVNGILTFTIAGANLMKVGFYTIEIVAKDSSNSENVYRNLIPNAFTITENAYEVDDETIITDSITLQRISKDGEDGGTPTVTVYQSTDDTYVLRITNADGTSFNTPNLKGSSGSDGDSGNDGTSLTYYGQYDSLATAQATIPASELKQGLLIRVLNSSNVGIIYVYQNGQWVLFLTDGDDGINGENGTSGVDGTTYKWMYSASTDRSTEPDCSITFQDPNTNLTAALWQYSPDITTTESPYLWMIQAQFNSEGDVVIQTSGTYWTLPVCITGADGQNGTDGSGVEFIYQVGTSSTVPATPSSQNTNDYVPSGWTNHPSGVSQTYMYEYLCQRTKTGDTWGDFQAPVIWAKWGEKGQDGDGYEYIFATTQTSTTPTTPTAAGIADDEVPSGWYDNPIGVSQSTPYEWTSKRKKSNGVWGLFSTPALWAKYAANGVAGSSMCWQYAISNSRSVAPECSTTTQDPNASTEEQPWSSTNSVTTTKPYLWMIQGLLDVYGNIDMINATQYWTNPVCITGNNGVAGADGVDGIVTEFVYKRTTTYTAPTTPATSQSDDNIPSGWTDNPAGITETYVYEWVSTRKKEQGSWSAYSTPVVWSMWGSKGQDGDGYEYIFITTTTVSSPNQPVAIGTDDDEVPSGWYDEPISVSSTYPYEWVSIRKKTDGVWSSFSIPALWAKYAVNGSNGAAGRYGVTIRTTTWQTGTSVSDPITYRNDSDSVETRQVYYLDIVLYYESDGTTTLWQCVQTHNSYTGNTHTPGTDTAYWTAIEEATPIHTALLLADNAKINLGQLNDLIITKLVSGNLQVTAGLSGDTTNNDGTDVRFWSGALSTQKSSAPFRVTEDGTMYATKAEIVGSITANTAIFTGGSRTITKKIVFGDSGTDYTISMLSDLNATYANMYAGQVNVFLPATIDYDGAEAFILNTDYYDGSNVNSYPFLLTLTSAGFITAKISATGLKSTGEILGIRLNGNAYAKLRAVWVAAITSTGEYDTFGKLIWMLENTTDFTAEETSTGSGRWVLNSKTNNWG